MNKPTVTVTPDDGGHDNTISVAGVKQTAYEPNDKYEHYDDSDFLYHAIERIAELEAERDRIREKVATWKGLVEDNQAIALSVIEERDALAAHVERLKERFSPAPWPVEHQPDGSILPVDPDEYFGTPQTSLAQRDARTKAEAYWDASLQLSIKHGPAIRRLREIAAEYRQQAEENNQ